MVGFSFNIFDEFIEEREAKFTHCLEELSKIKGNEVSRHIYETSRQLLEMY